MAKDLYVGALLDVYGAFLSEKQRVVAQHYYFDDLSLAEIAENEGITRQGVRDLIMRATEELYSFEKKCGYEKKFRLLKTLAENINENNEKIVQIINDL